MKHWIIQLEELLKISLNPTGIDVGLGVKISGIQKNFTEGDLKLTSNPYDLAIQGKVFSKSHFQVEKLIYEMELLNWFLKEILLNANGYLPEPAITIPEDAKDYQIGKRWNSIWD